MATVQVQPLNSLSPSAPTILVDGGVVYQKPTNWAAGLVTFIILVVIIWLIIYSVKPAWALTPGTANLDNGKALWSSIIIAIVIMIIIWLIKSLMTGGKSL
jgi:hypothetical protein